MRIKSISLRRQLVILFMISILLVMIVQLYYTINIFQKKTEENKANCYITIMQTNAMLTQITDSVTSIGNMVSNNEYIQELLYLNDDGKSKNLDRRMEIRDVVLNYLESMLGANKVVSEIALIDTEEAIITAKNRFSYLPYKMLNEKYDIPNKDKKFYSSWISLESQEQQSGFAFVVPIFYTTGDFQKIRQRLGTTILWCNQKPLIEIVKTTAATDGATVLIADSEGVIMALNSNYSISELSLELEAMLIDKKDEFSDESIIEMEFMNQKSFVLVKEHESTGWKSINIVPIKGIYQETYQTLYLGMGLAAASIIILLGFGTYMLHCISKPLANITSTLARIGNGERKKRIEMIEQNEFGVIGESINTMLDNVDNMNHRIFDMQSQLYEKELMQKETEMLTLQSQINPHFLYNTLECIRAIAVIHKISEIPIITTSMAKIFRYSIKGGMYATIKKELECVNDYYKIIAIRYNDRLSMEFDVHERLMNNSMLKMSLQPIIENSVYHGLEATEDAVKISIKGRVDGEYAVLSIHDNGAGMEFEKADAINEELTKATLEDLVAVGKSKGSIGLANINARIKLYYGDECGLRIDSSQDTGTTVTIKIKLSEEI
ncbi:MAG: integral rane sensor signal transduction histidine kinase [Herbinix sp.]|nr:integral rane sensor signal transduction histidine kinase [Herbinix sp.]